MSLAIRYIIGLLVFGGSIGFMMSNISDASYALAAINATAVLAAIIMIYPPKT